MLKNRQKPVIGFAAFSGTGDGRRAKVGSGGRGERALERADRRALCSDDDHGIRRHFLILIRIFLGYFTQIRLAEHGEDLLPGLLGE